MTVGTIAAITGTFTAVGEATARQAVQRVDGIVVRDACVRRGLAVSGLRSERTTLLSLGDDACRFRVLQTDDPLAGHLDALEQRFSGEREAG